MWDFSQEVKDINQVPEQFRHIYSTGEGEDADKLVIHEQYNALTQAIIGLNGSLHNSRKVEREISGALTPWQALGETPEAVQQVIANLTSERDDALAKNKAFDPKKMQEQMRSEWDEKLTAATNETNQLKSELKDALINSAALGAISKHEGEPKLLMPLIRSQVRMVQDPRNGRQIVQVVDEEGMVRYSATSGELMSVDELVSEMKASPTLGMAFKSNMRMGGGKVDGSGNRVLHGKSVGDMSATEKISAGLGN